MAKDKTPKEKNFTIRQVDEVRWEIPQTGRMLVPGMIYASSELMPNVEKDNAAEQVYNVAHLPGILRQSMALPDVHWGYGFPIGGVAAFDLDGGVVSPGGVGYDINCGVRALTTGMLRRYVEPQLKKLVDQLFRDIPCGLGSSTDDLVLDRESLSEVAIKGAGWAIEHGMGNAGDLDKIEESGCIQGADPSILSDRTFERGYRQLGTLGSGNHFLEIQYIEEVFDEVTAKAWGLNQDEVVVMIHSGSRGFGYQICDEFLAKMIKQPVVDTPDKQLACAFLGTYLADQYLAAMAAGANYAFANRQIMTHLARQSFTKVFSPQSKGDATFPLTLLYDVCHNIAKIEEHVVDGKTKKVCVHRKGATRALPAGHPLLSGQFVDHGQPVIIPGDMGRSSYILAGEPGAEETWMTSCHGAGREWSRGEALRQTKDRDVIQELADKGIYTRHQGAKTMREECSEAYKDVNTVVDVVAKAGIARPIVRLRPIGCIKG
jgi:tRNA-splicing ligase RtcB (3'-phosphate/5'-hydroxy nucleic acid ligase)